MCVGGLKIQITLSSLALSVCVRVCAHCIPERILEGLDPLACPLPGEGSQGRGWELLQHSERYQDTHANTHEVNLVKYCTLVQI